MKKYVSILLCIMMLCGISLQVCAEEMPECEQKTIDTEQQTQATEQEIIHVHSWTETDTATCVTDGVWTQICSCGESNTRESKAKGHEFEAWNTSAAAHDRKCKYCDVFESGNHDFEEEIVKKATCMENGSKRKYCTVCRYQETIVLAKLTSHTYDNACDSECNVCEWEREIEHNFATTLTKDEDGHWYACSKCEEKKDFEKHNAGPEATEEKDQVCTTCSYVIEAKKVHTHNFEAEWTSDEVGHWHTCRGKTCEAEQGYASHVFDDECDSDCNTCEYERTNRHEFDTDGWITSNFEHWSICAVCGEESKHEKHVAGPDATDIEAQTCTICGFELKAKQEHIHDFGKTYIGEEDLHWQACECGELSVPESHIWDKGRENKNNTITFRCTLCDVEKTEAVSAGFPWLTVILGFLALLCVGGIVVLVILLKRGHFDEDDVHDDIQDEIHEDYIQGEDLIMDVDRIIEEELSTQAVCHQDLPIQDPEEKAIDDYFASINRKNNK